MQKSKILILTIFLFLSVFTYGQDKQLYKTMVVRAAPGQLSALIDRLKADLKGLKSETNRQGYLLRHSQGDQWDLMLISPISRYADYFEGKESEILERSYGDDYYNLVARQEEAFVTGPTLEEFNKIFEPNSFFHIEMFLSLGGKQQELKKEREMENVYLKETNRDGNLIFVRENGFIWDIFTIGGYESLEVYAKGSNQPAEVQEAAAKVAGFDSASDIGFYLREFLNEHHDTLANKVE